MSRRLSALKNEARKFLPKKRKNFERVRCLRLAACWRALCGEHHLPQLRHLQHINVHTYARTHRRAHTHACNMHANRLDFLFCLLLLFMHCKLPAGRDTCCCCCCCACVGVAVVSAACGALNFFAFRCHCRCQQPQLPPPPCSLCPLSFGILGPCFHSIHFGAGRTFCLSHLCHKQEADGVERAKDKLAGWRRRRRWGVTVSRSLQKHKINAHKKMQ